MIWFRRLSIAAIVLAVAGFIGFQIFKVSIAERIFERAITQNMSGNRFAELPDGLHVYMCGTGSPMADLERAGPCMAVQAGDRAFVFDAGSGSMRTLGRMGFDFGHLEGVYLTHLHSDHLDGLGELLLQAWVAGSRSEPLPVSGPAGVEEVVAGFAMAYRIDGGYRTAHHGPGVANPEGFGGVATALDLEQGSAVIFDEDGITITVFSVDHAPIRPAYGYRVDYAGRSIAISGDTLYSSDLVAASQDVDVLFHEGIQVTMTRVMGEAATAANRPNIAKILADIEDYHATPEDAARAASDANAGQLVFYHMIPPLPSSLLYPVFLGDAAEAYSGPIRIAEDGMLISLPADSESVDFSDAVR